MSKPTKLPLAFNDLTREEKEVLLYVVYPGFELDGLDDSFPPCHWKHVEAAEKVLQLGLVRIADGGRTVYRGEKPPLTLRFTKKGSDLLKELRSEDPWFLHEMIYSPIGGLRESKEANRRKYNASETFFNIFKAAINKYGPTDEGLTQAARAIVDVFDLRDPFGAGKGKRKLSDLEKAVILAIRKHYRDYMNEPIYLSNKKTRVKEKLHTPNEIIKEIEGQTEFGKSLLSEFFDLSVRLVVDSIDMTKRKIQVGNITFHVTPDGNGVKVWAKNQIEQSVTILPERLPGGTHYRLYVAGKEDIK